MTLVENSGLTGLLFVDTSGTYGVSPTFTKVAGQRTGTMNRGTNVVDARSKDAVGWPRNIIINNTYTVDFSGVYMTDDVTGILDPSLLALQTGWNTFQRLYYKLEIPVPNTTNGAQNQPPNAYIFPASLSKFNFDMPFDNVYTYTATIEGYGQPTFVSPSA